MDLYLAGTDVNLSVPIVDAGGNALDVTAISYRVVDQDEIELIPLTSLATYSEGNLTALITVPAINNAAPVVPIDSLITSKDIDTFNTRSARTVEVHCTLASGNIFPIRSTYILEISDPLRIAINSFQTLVSAELAAMDMTPTIGWNGAADSDKIAALIEARKQICQLNFWLLNSNTNWGQDNLNYVPEGSYQTPYATAGNNSMFIFNGNLALLTPLMYQNLPERFKTALRLAQVAQADYLLGGDPLVQKRQEGLLLDSIGEVKQMYRAGKPLDLPICKRALRYVSAFVTFSKRLGRG